ncbi:hypothetical protein K4K55_010023 [Colletotrichum sp. SAR 10_96]|nr:hypothetical protein K4K55_010023 [Colletotrichum sp. SAR 10_96]
MSFSNDGYEWTPEGGLKTGLPTDAVIDPPKLLPNPEKEFDVIVVGAGVLLLEGRDRIGGRSWTVKKDGYVCSVWKLKDSMELYEGSREPTVNRDGVLIDIPFTDETALARSMFDDACSSGNLSYSFKTPVSRISTEANMITVTANSGSSFVAQHVIVAVPLNCLKDITFDPALPPLKAEASLQGHSNHAYKVCVEVAGKDWRNWQGHAFPDKGIPFLIGDGTTPQGNSYLITTPGDYINPQQEPEKLLDALQYLHPDLKIQRIFGCDYFSDPFSKGGWAVHSPGFVMKYLKALQAPVGNIHFASADWADLWRVFIDGALESGARAVSAIHLQRAAA